MNSLKGRKSNLSTICFIFTKWNFLRMESSEETFSLSQLCICNHETSVLLFFSIYFNPFRNLLKNEPGRVSEGMQCLVSPSSLFTFTLTLRSICLVTFLKFCGCNKTRIPPEACSRYQAKEDFLVQHDFKFFILHTSDRSIEKKLLAYFSDFHTENNNFDHVGKIVQAVHDNEGFSISSSLSIFVTNSRTG